MQQNGDDTSVSVDIYDQVYRLRGVDAKHITELGEYVDGRMRAVAAHGTTVDTLRVAVLAALNIADELMELRQRHRDLLQTVDQAEERTRTRASSLAELLDGALEEHYREPIAV